MPSLVETLRDRLGNPALLADAQPLRGDWDFGELGAAAGLELKPAAVLVPVVDRPEPGLILTKRTSSLRNHAGQVAFPGGRIDPEDAGPVEAALREAREEIGLASHHVSLIGRAGGYETGSGYAITPIVGLVPPDVPLSPSVDEVDQVFEVPLAYVLDAANHQVQQAEWRGRMRRYYVIEYGPWNIWGATAGILVNLARLVA